MTGIVRYSWPVQVQGEKIPDNRGLRKLSEVSRGPSRAVPKPQATFHGCTKLASLTLQMKISLLPALVITVLVSLALTPCVRCQTCQAVFFEDSQFTGISQPFPATLGTGSNGCSGCVELVGANRDCHSSAFGGVLDFGLTV